jgi:poly [ADP-ribose] polymerase
MGEIVEPYDCTLNMTDIKSNNNKFYIMQILKNNNEYCLYINYGRIGETGRKSYEKGSLEYSIQKFKSQFKTKTKNNWDSRSDFKHYEGKYYLCDKYKPVNLELELSTKLKTNLDSRVVNLLQLIGNINMLTNTLKILNIDSSKLPLGAISQEQLKKATDVLNQLQLEQDPEKIIQLSSKYYTLVPVETHRSKPPVIDNITLLNSYRDKLDELSNLKIAYTAVSDSDNTNTNTINKHPADMLYEKLDTIITPIEKDGKLWNIIKDYIFNTTSDAHHCKVELVDIYEINRKNEFNSPIENKHLLWHGTRLSNIISILKLGLLLRPEAISGVHISGKMFGNGIYGANSFSKSFNYCSSQGEACLFLAEFSLGATQRLINAEYVTTSSLGDFNSVWGQGRNTPNSNTVFNNVIIPNGKLVKSNINAKLFHDEFIIYDTSQIKLKYIVHVKNA